MPPRGVTADSAARSSATCSSRSRVNSAMAPKLPSPQWLSGSASWPARMVSRDWVIVVTASRRRRQIAARPSFLDRGMEIREPSSLDRRAHAAHELLIISEIDARKQHRAEHLVGLGKVMQIGARIGPRRRMRAIYVERAFVTGVPRVGEID